MQRRHAVGRFGYFISETSTLDQVVHLCGYKDVEDRRARGAAMAADPDWTADKKMTADGRSIQQQENQPVLSAQSSKI